MTNDEKNRLAQKALVLTERVEKLEAAFQEFAQAVFEKGFEIEFSGDALESINKMAVRLDSLEKSLKLISHQKGDTSVVSTHQKKLAKLNTAIKEVTARTGKAEMNIQALQKEVNSLRALVREQAVELDRIKLRR